MKIKILLIFMFLVCIGKIQGQNLLNYNYNQAKIYLQKKGYTLEEINLENNRKALGFDDGDIAIIYYFDVNNICRHYDNYCDKMQNDKKFFENVLEKDYDKIGEFYYKNGLKAAIFYDSPKFGYYIRIAEEKYF
jgi:hypothetical protein